ncbi:MAG: hypothetical protein KAR14_13785 [Candidatus Aminicenantes bacterium]|nr:hypothetical protein [Candidatus Aminicenantes bacterium]
MKITRPFTGIVAFAVVLFTMPLGHAVMILMEKGFGKDHIYFAALFLGFLGLLLLILGVISSSENKATFMGFFGGLFIWTGWIEFAYVYYANRYGVEPLISNGEIVTKPEYLIMPSSIGFWAVMMIYYFFGTKTGCKFFNWLQKKLKFSNLTDLKPAKRNITMTTFLELIALLWTFYLVLLFLYDNNFVGEKHLVTYIVAFGSLLWSLYLFLKLIKITKIPYAVRYAIPTVIIFWNFIEILGRWDFFKEIWIEPEKYWIEMLLILGVFVILIFIASMGKKKNKIT